ncbi:MAG: hypothetical protein PHP79_00755 [Clostridia bacterium]|nr:hypothetical protein [Clostridia bacterium]MDD4679408.1 hypothetical protein [Clostridia bacterium]
MIEINNKTVEIADLRPIVLQVGYNDMLRNNRKKGIKSPERYSFDYEIEFFTASSGKTIVCLKDKLYVSTTELNNSSEFFPFEYNITIDILNESNLFSIDKFGGELVVSR